MANTRAFEAQTNDALQELQTSPQLYKVAVLKTGAAAVSIEVNKRYVWFNCTIRTSIKQIREAYDLAISESGDEYVLQFNAKILEDHIAVGELDENNNRLVILDAVTKPKSSDLDKIDGQSQHSMAFNTSRQNMTLSAAEITPKEPQTVQLQTLIQTAPSKVLALGVKEGVNLLDKLKTSMITETDDNPDVAEWVKSIDALVKQANPTKTVIGIVGNTGAGKSSLINTILDQDRLVPTNCMRACTAVVTEISYNNKNDQYRARIEFVQQSEWERELRTLFQELLDGEGNVSKECANESTDAGIAFAKIKAVYPAKSKEEISKSSIDGLLQEVSHLLGGSLEIEEPKSKVFYKRLQKLIDSKERIRKTKHRGANQGVKERAYWPLIKVVKIYVKSPVLSTGCVLVDLPGMHDSNVARAAVAAAYMKETTGLWIVAPINRAVDDKTASMLLGDAFKRQLKMDGGFNTVTFVCSKTDDISVSEAQESLGLEDELEPLRENIQDLELEEKELRIKWEALKNSQNSYNQALLDANDQLEVWQELLQNFQSGEEVHWPNLKAAQKRAGSKQERKGKRLCQNENSETDSDVEVVTSSSSDEDAVDDHVQQENDTLPLSKEQILIKIVEIRSMKQSARASKIDCEERIKNICERQEKVKILRKEQKMSILSKCISERNRYSKMTIQQQYAAGIRDLDYELAAEEDEEFNPDDDTKDYDKVAEDFPVFCVSARGYQSLKGRMPKDKAVSSFGSIEETGIPMLQKHCITTTEAVQVATHHRFLVNLSQLLNSLIMWASSDSLGTEMTEEQKAIQERNLAANLEILNDHFHKIVKNTADEMRQELSDSIFSRFDVAVSRAVREATITSEHWARPINKEEREKGGYWWSTYRALCVRDGVHTFQKQVHNWNEALAAPMMKQVIPGWERMFFRRMPTILNSFAQSAFSTLADRHRLIDHEAHQLAIDKRGLRLLQSQIAGYDSVLKSHAKSVRQEIDSAQKDISRQFVPSIQTALRPAYAACANDHGDNMFKRIKTRMQEHVQDCRHTLFRDSADQVRDSLLEMIAAQETSLLEKADEVLQAVGRDCTSVLIRGVVPEEAKLRESRQQLRKQVLEILDTTEAIFRKVNALADSGNDIEDLRQIPSITEGRTNHLVELDRGELQVKDSGTQVTCPEITTARPEDTEDTAMLDVSESSKGIVTAVKTEDELSSF